MGLTCGINHNIYLCVNHVNSFFMVSYKQLLSMLLNNAMEYKHTLIWTFNGQGLVCFSGQWSISSLLFCRLEISRNAVMTSSQCVHQALNPKALVLFRHIPSQTLSLCDDVIVNSQSLWLSETASVSCFWRRCLQLGEKLCKVLYKGKN